MDTLWAHTPGKSSGEWHDLHRHLLDVAAAAERSAAKFGVGDFGRALGLSHDAAKADPRFQRYLQACAVGQSAPKCPHAHPSALAAYASLGPFALAVMGHHTGIPNRSDFKGIRDNLDGESLSHASGLLRQFDLPQLEASTPEWAKQDKRAAEFLLRMAFSCLVDADFLDTEAHFQGRDRVRRARYRSLEDYRRMLDAYLGGFGSPAGTVNRHRAEILDECRSAAASTPGFFDLQVPTGGGKTLSGMAFALDHAVANRLDRVIVAIPYTSIIDQTAQVYKMVFGDEAVLEHHSALEVDEDEHAQSQTDTSRRLAAENWDCPLIVTTTVQLFESLLSNRPARCRKLHNIARSLLILDEVQTLPTHLLGPILDVLNELVTHYGCTVVFSTATLPDFAAVLKAIPGDRTALVSDFARHYVALKRVEYVVVSEPWSPERAAAEIAGHPQVLAVFNTRKDALRVARLLDGCEGLLHLSTLLCGHHRKEVIRKVKGRLQSGLPVRLVSTQVVEAGVDLDFSVAMRDLGPLDRIVQVAGRCNREGNLGALGRCLVFRLEGGGTPKGAYATATAIARTLLDELGDDFDRPETMARYSRELFAHTETGSQDDPHDQADIQRLREDWAFADVAQAFRMIDQATVPILVERYRGANVPALIARWEFAPGGWFRRVGPYTVSVYEHERRRLVAEGHLRSHDSGLWIYSGPYDSTFGLSPDFPDPSDLVA